MIEPRRTSLLKKRSSKESETVALVTDSGRNREEKSLAGI